MSLASWKKEYYPKAPSKSMTEVEALKHSIRKWSGLRDRALKKHGGSAKPDLTEFRYSIKFFEEDGSLLRFSINSSTCALCRRHGNANGTCKNCSLYKALGNSRCDEKNNPYYIWVKKANPNPMIKALRLALKMELRKEEFDERKTKPGVR